MSEQTHTSPGAVAESAGDSNNDQDRQLQLHGWFTEQYQDIDDELHTQVTADKSEEALCCIAADFPKCRAKPPEQFRKWVSHRISKHAEDARDSIATDQLSLQEALAASKPERKGTKPLVCEQHGDKVFIQLTDARGKVLPWIIPADWLPIAKRLWPVHVKYYPQSGPYVAKKISRGPKGQREQITVPLHRLFVDCGGQKLVGDHTAQSVVTKDGNYLNWTDDNLGPLKPWTSRDLMDCCTVFGIDNEETVTADDTYAKPTRIPPKQDPKRESKGSLRSRFWCKTPEPDYLDLNFPI